MDDEISGIIIVKNMLDLLIILNIKFMKKLCVAFLLVLISGQIFSQSEEKFVIKINPLSALISTGSMFLETRLDNTKSLQMGVAYMGLGFGDIKYSGIILTPELRFYAKQRALSGGYIAPYFRFQRYSITDESTSPNSEISYTSYGGGLLFGRQWVFDSGFVFDMFAGPSFNEGKIKYESGTSREDNFLFGLNGVGIRIGVALGFGF